MHKGRARLIWALLAATVVAPVLAAATSPLLAWRDPVYIMAGFAGIVAMVLVLVQPLLAGGYLPDLPLQTSRRIHRLTGAGLVIAITAHVVGLWITSPPDVVDALRFASPTAFSVWGVIAMWAVAATALLSVLRKFMRANLRLWRRLHTALGLVIVAGSVVHAILIEGTMETLTKTSLCGLALAAVIKATVDLRAFAKRSTPR